MRTPGQNMRKPGQNMRKIPPLKRDRTCVDNFLNTRLNNIKNGTYILFHPAHSIVLSFEVLVEHLVSKAVLFRLK